MSLSSVGVRSISALFRGVRSGCRYPRACVEFSVMSGNLRFDGRVAIVTGAGNGLGKEYALAFAERGAKVVVNDLGGDFKGEGGASRRAADLVVDEIRSKGGEAVANYDSVENGDKVVQTALDNYGKVDILVNNAGILRDRSFARTSDLDWDLVNRVHLRGTFQVTRAAWPHMKNQKYGRIINVTSTSGLYGNFGQANYSAAKMGVVGLGFTLAIEGQKYNIGVNIVAPTAGSRMTQTVMSSEIVDLLKPEYVAPLVVYLCHESFEDSGGIYECGGGWVAKSELHRSPGATVRVKGQKMTPEQVRDSWNNICDMTGYTASKSSGEAAGTVYQKVQLIDSSAETNTTPQNTSRLVLNNTSSSIDPKLAIGQKLPKTTFTYTDKEVMLYALGVGESTVNPGHLKFLFEFSEDFSVLPSFGVVPAFPALSASVSAKGLSINPTQILHGEQYLELFKPLPTSGTLTSEATVVDVVDKGRGAILVMDVNSVDEQGEKVAYNQFVTFVQNAGGFGGKRSSAVQKPTANPPKRPPDATITEKTSLDQAALYRLSGDRNPLHIDPSFAAMGGFSKPILHGLASFGYATRHVLKQYANNDVAKFKAIKVRFSAPVLPGQSVRTEMWKEGNRIHFVAKVAETGDTCLSGAYIDLHGAASTSSASEDSSGGLPSDQIFEAIKFRVSEDPSLVKKVKAIFSWKITDGGKPAKEWTVDLKGGSVYQGAPKSGKADCTVTLEDSTFMDLASGKINGQMAFMRGKLKIAGNIMLAQKIGQLFQDQAKL